MRRDLETPIHVEIVEWIRLVAPRLIVAHSPNGGLRAKSTATRLKDMGVLAGWPDLQLIDEQGRTYFLEVKAPKGSLSAEQRAFRDECLTRLIPFAVVHSIDEASRTLAAWGIRTREVL